MRMLRMNINLILALAILAWGVAISYSVLAQAPQGPTDEEIATQGITFPIAELGNCGSKDDCRRYCEEPANMSACIEFAKRHGLMNEEEAQRAQNFAQVIRSEGGPGGCKSPRECEIFCRSIQNMETCLAFAEAHNIRDKYLDQARRILNYLKAGGEMPGGCNSKESCEAYCGDFSHAEECFNFAKRAGIIQEKAGTVVVDKRRFEEHEIGIEQFEKFLELAKRGETPGGCKSKDECEAYCSDSVHFEECIAFGEKMGFMTPEQAAFARRTGGKGPGGCNSPRACQTYCEEHQEECFKFAEEHGFISKEELKHAREGFVRLRQGLETAPPEVVACLRGVVGSDVLDDIQAGKFVPGPKIGERVKQCFFKHGREASPQRPFADAPEEVKTCLREKLGDTFDKIVRGKEFPTPEMADTFRVCFQNVQLERREFEGPKAAPPQDIQNFARTAPPVIAECLKARLGDDFEKLVKGEGAPGPELHEKLKECFESFRPPAPFEEAPPEVFKPPEGRMFPPPPTSTASPPFFSNLPPEVIECVRLTIGVNLLEPGTAVGPEIGTSIKACFEKLRSNIAPPTAMPPTSIKPVCIQVITPAYDPASGVCKDFPTPCDVPPSWQKGCPIKKEEYKYPEATTVDPAQKCAEAGGNWDGSTCIFPQPEAAY